MYLPSFTPITIEAKLSSTRIISPASFATSVPLFMALTDAEFSGMTDEEIKDIIPRLRVIASCSPTTKLRLITLAQELGYSTAMTGDGTNDAPALTKSDVGFAMNSGTDVKKEPVKKTGYKKFIARSE